MIILSVLKGLEALIEFKKSFFDALAVMQQQHVTET